MGLDSSWTGTSPFYSVRICRIQYLSHSRPHGIMPKLEAPQSKGVPGKARSKPRRRRLAKSWCSTSWRKRIESISECDIQSPRDLGFYNLQQAENAPLKWPTSQTASLLPPRTLVSRCPVLGAWLVPHNYAASIIMPATTEAYQRDNHSPELLLRGDCGMAIP
jgi:hypothetical protein